ncbi:hypothetical protein CFAM422_005759 [Trichoderma lentiforme]|uniref:Uncharacterized protein n=1 Tax=Trichoderma lentiforme TaxID=1567552 RepID=A0A9P5CF51_9HYPO|nr:hypothetical protein CFAM422_005759 [Trichoderma lentiforme]
MPGKSRLDRVYAQLMSDHPYGWALYKQVTTRDIHPGSCGYFDSEGDWNTITDLSSPQDLISQGWAIPDEGIYDNNGPGSTTWGPKSSNSIRTRCIGGTARATETATSLKTSITVSFESKSDQGAVLFTENPVLRHQVGDELSALQWMAENTPEMRRRHKNIIKTHGLWIVTKIYSTRRCAIAIMNSESSSVVIDLDNAHGLLTLSPNSKWTSSSGSSCTEIHEDQDGIVVFISGIYFSQKPFRSKLGGSRDEKKQRDEIFRSGSDDSEDNENELQIEWFPPYDEDGEEGEEDIDEFT